MNNLQDNITAQVLIKEIIIKLQQTTMEQPYMNNAIKRVGDAIERFKVGRYTGGSV